LPDAFIVSFILSEAVTFYPASGNRNSTSGAFSAIGSSGYAWNGAVNSGAGFFLRFFDTEVNPSRNSGDRSTGFGVRCVQHLFIFA